MTEPSLAEKVAAIHRALTRARVGHAFGGAQALAYYAEPRATADIDVNVFVAAQEFGSVLAALAPLGVDVSDPRTTRDVARDGQARVSWGRTPVDLFASSLDFHEAMQRDARLKPYGDDTIAVLAPEHLVACKAIYNRRKDWLDIEQVLVATPDYRRGEAVRWVAELAGGDDPRTRRLEQMERDLL